jgi:hypothetical protein
MSDQDDLTVQQEKAIQLLMLGGSDQSVADELDVARQTVNNWKHNDAAFAARFNDERQALWSTHREKLRSLVARAVEVLAEDMDTKLEPKLRQNAAIHVLKAVGLYGQDMKPSGAVDSAQVEKGWQADDDLMKMFEGAGVSA